MPRHSYRKNRASMEQLLFFVNYARNNPKMLTSKFGAVSDLWETLAQQLNTMDGAYRTAEKWKENMFTWRCQLRCRARRGRSSGVPEFDAFAMCNLGQQGQANVDEGELTEQDTDDEDSSRASKKFKVTCENESEHEFVMEPEAKVEIKTEIEENTTRIMEAYSVTTEQHSEPDVTLDFEEDIYIKTEFGDDGNATNIGNTSTELDHLPTLGFAQNSPSDTFDISPATTTANTSTKFAMASNSGNKQIISCVSNTHGSNNASKAAVSKRRVVTLPSSKGMDSDTVLSLSSKLMTKISKGLDETSKQKEIVLPSSRSSDNRAKVIHLDNGLLKIIRASSPITTLNKRRVKTIGTSSQTTALDTTKVQIIGESRITTPLDISTKTSDVVEAESYNTEDSLQSASSSPALRLSEGLSNASRKRRTTCLNEMYETVLTSMKKRDEREEQILSVLQGLTVAVAKLADNVKRLEEALTFGTINN